MIFELDVRAIRLRRAFGFIGDIKLKESQGAPFSPQIIHLSLHFSVEDSGAPP